MSVQALGGVVWGTDTVRGMYVMSGKAQLACECVGDPEGVDVFLIHAGVIDRRSWQHVIDRLSPEHRCVSYDARGYGETLYEPEDGWSPVNDALAVLDAVNSDRSCVIACSAGGQTAIDLVLAQPERVAAMVLIGSGSGVPRPRRPCPRRQPNWLRVSRPPSPLGICTRSTDSRRGCGSMGPAQRRDVSLGGHASCFST